MKENESKPLDCYKPDKRIKEFINNRIEFNEILRSKDRSRFSEEDKNFDTRIRQDKKRLLDNIIFPSMANLLIFFKYMSDKNELRDLFEEDIKELFDIKYNVIGKFLDALLAWDMDKDPNNFRLDLIKEIQQTIFDKVAISITNNIIDKEKPTIIGQTIDNDMRRALSWTELLADRYIYDSTKWGIDRIKKSKRPIQFY